MKIAFLVLNHRPPAQLVRLVTTLRAQLPDAPIVVHHDVFHGELPAAVLEPIDNVHLLQSGKRVIWGDFSQVEICCWSLGWMRDNLDFDWVVLLSAQDYPIKPLAGLADDLTKNGTDAVFHATPISQQTMSRRILMHRRYFFQYRPGQYRPLWSRSAEAGRSSRLPDGMRGFFRRISWGLIQVLNIVQPLFRIYPLPDGMAYRFGWRARNVPFTRERPCWEGSSWFALSRRALDYLLNYMDSHPEYVEYYRVAMCPDESMFATIICNSPDFQVANRNITYTRWVNDMTPHPDIFHTVDLKELISVPEYFARKFDIDQDSRIIDELDALIGVRV